MKIKKGKDILLAHWFIKQQPIAELGDGLGQVEVKRSTEKIAVEREDLVLEFVKTGDIPVDLFAELSAFGGVVVAVAAFIAEKPKLVGGRGHKRNEAGLPLFGHID